MPASETGSDYDYNDSPEHSRPGTGNNNNNNNTGQKKKTIKKRKVKVPLSIEEVFNKPSTMTASNINPPPARVVLTPRSAEACLKLGVNPEVIKIRDIDSFWEPDIDPSVQRMRHEAYVQRRYEVMKQLRTERKKLMNSEFHQDRSSPGIIGLSPEQILKQQQEQSITMLELEKKRLEKMKERQERELEQMLQYEINRTKLQQDMEKRIQESKKKEELRKKQQEKRMKLMVEERKLRELQKLSMEEAEEAQRREMAKIMYEREQKILQDMKDKEAEEKEKLKQLEYERKMKQEQHREQVQKYFVEEQMKLRSRLEALNEAEERKQQKLLKQQEEKKIQLKIKRDMVEQRISKNMEMAAMVEKKRKDDFLTKQEKTELLRQQHLQDQENQRILHQQELEIQEQRRKIILLQQRREEEQKKEEMLQQFEENNRHVEEIRALQEHEQHLIKEKKNLILQMKAENVERVKRMSEYKRLNILKKIEQNDDRTNQLLDARQQLIKQRRETSIKTKKQKDDLNRLMEEVRTDASKANKIINMALKGNVSLKSIMSSTAERSSTGSIKNKSNSRSHSPNNKNKRGVTHSAGDIPTGMNSNSDSMKFELQESHHTNPLPYISPYELNSGQSSNNNNNNKKSQKITL